MPHPGKTESRLGLAIDGILLNSSAKIRMLGTNWDLKWSQMLFDAGSGKEGKVVIEVLEDLKDVSQSSNAVAFKIQLTNWA
jgi:hypothetical protein